jgi:hypothetical protein
VKDQIVPTRNVLLMSEMLAEILARRPGSRRFGLVEGPAGTGKTSIAKMLAKQYGGIFYSVSELETSRSLLSGLADAVNGSEAPAYSNRVWYQRLLDELEYAGWPPLMLDEADRLDRTRSGVSLLEVVRDIHDRGRSPIILFSIAHLAQRLAHPVGEYAEAFSSRVAAHVRFERATLEDGELLAQRLLEDVKLDADLIAHCIAVSRFIPAAARTLCGNREGREGGGNPHNESREVGTTRKLRRFAGGTSAANQARFRRGEGGGVAMRAYEPLPADAEAYIEDAIRRGASSVRELSRQLLEKFGVRRGKSWLASYVRTTLRRRFAEDALLERRLRLLKREFGDQPEVLAKVAAEVMKTNPKPAARRRRKRAAVRR